MTKKFLFVTATVLAYEAVLVFCIRLLREGQEVAVMGPIGLEVPEGVQQFTRVSESREFNPDVVIPMDETSIRAVQNFWEEDKPKFLNKEPLAYQMASTRSFGLSLLAKAGMPVVPYHCLNNPGDHLRFQAKQMESVIPWITVQDHPDVEFANEFGNLAIQQVPGNTIRVAFLLSGRNLVKPSFAYEPLLGLLDKGGTKDYRGMLVIPSSSPEMSRVGEIVRTAVSAIGANGFVFVDLLYPEDGSAPMATRLSLSPPRGFLAALMISDILEQPLAQALYSTSKGTAFKWQIKWGAEAWAFLVTNQAQFHPPLPDERGFLQTSRDDSAEYQVGYYISTSPNVPDSLWDVQPSAEVKLNCSSEKFMAQLLATGLYADYSPRKLEPVLEEEPSEEEPEIVEEVAA